ncbi:TPA: hypothetical protein DCW54_01545 [Candidatus Dependentiae bacterium]|nr:hypothetical protein [Candidatus Dependentiae bacterium]
MNLRSNRPGFILMFTMMILAAGVVLVGAVALRVHNAIKEYRFLIARERSKIAALGGVELARTRLTHIDDKKKDEEARVWLLAHNDIWQTIPLPDAEENARDRIDMRIALEDGKIDLNAFFDPKKKVFVFGKTEEPNPFWDAVSRWVATSSPAVGEGEFFGFLKAALKERKEPLIDFTEIFSAPEFNKTYVSLFPTPPRDKEGQDAIIVSGLADLFVFAPFFDEKQCMQPPFLSNALVNVLELKPLPQEKDQREQWAKEFVKKKLAQDVQWPTAWDQLLASTYGKKYQELTAKYSQITSLFCSAARESMVSVISYGFVGGVTQGVYAVLRPYQSKDKMTAYVVTRLYWI